ncbi:MAG: FUSC family protein [Culicoidibacterales bacterium]
MKPKQLMQLIITKTGIFVAILLFVNLFSLVFGSANTLLGVSTLTLVLSLLGQNLLPNFSRNLATLLGINLLFGLAAFLAPLQLIGGLLINFAIVFSIGYFFSFTFRRSLTLLVGLHYLFLLYAPIDGADLPLRLLALASGPLLIMASQWLVHRQKLQKLAATQVAAWQTELTTTLAAHTPETVIQFDNLREQIEAFKLVIHDATPQARSLNDYQNALLTIASTFEYLADLFQHHQAELTPQLTQAFTTACNQIIHQPNQPWFESWSQLAGNSPLANQLTALLHGLNHGITTWQQANPDQKAAPLPPEFSSRALVKRNFNLNNLNMRFALRLAIVIAGAFFITEFWDFTYGRWLVFTLFSLTQPYSEATIDRSKNRLIGTIIGAIIGFSALTLVPNPDYRLILILLFGYLSSYATDYRNTIIFVTITAVSSTALYSADPSASFLIRVSWIAIGMVLALVANQIILRTSYRDEATNLANLQTSIETYQAQQLFATELVQTTTSYFYSLAPTLALRIASSPHIALTQRYQLHRQRLLYLQQLTTFATLTPQTFATIKQLLTQPSNTSSKTTKLQALQKLETDPLSYHCLTLALQLQLSQQNPL